MDGAESMQAQINKAIAAGCLQTVMSLVHPELTKYVEFQRARVARADSSSSNSAPAAHGRRQNRYEGAGCGADESGSVAMHADQQTDISTQLKYLRDHWRSHLRYHGGDPQLPMIVHRAILYRNKVSHQSAMTLQQYEEAISTYEKLAELIECNVVIRRQIREVVDKMLSFSSISSVASAMASVSISTKSNVSRSDGNYASGVQPEREPSEERYAAPATAAPSVSVEDPPDYESESEEEQGEAKHDDRPRWEDLRSLGNEKFKAGDYRAAIDYYTQGMDIARHEPVLYSNRATCYLRLKEFELARDDAEDALDLDTDIVKHYRLLSEALMGLKEYEQAREICEEGLVLDDSDKTLLSRKKTVSAVIERLYQEKEAQKAQQREEERRQAAEAFKAGQKAARQASAVSSANENGALPRGTTLRSRNVNAMGIADPIKYDDMPLSDIDVQQRATHRFELYRTGVDFFTEAGSLWAQAIRLRSSGAEIEAVKKVVEKVMLNLKSAGEAGVAAAWYRMGLLYSGIDHGVPLVKDLEMQVDKFHKAAACKPFVQTPSGRIRRHSGVAEAENELGESFRDGNASVGRNLDRAFVYLLRSAQHDFAVGQFNVAKAYLNGEGTPKDPVAARFWASRAAQHQLAGGQALLARMFEEGIGGPKDASQARTLLEASRKNKKMDPPKVRDMTKTELYEWWLTTNPLEDTQATDYLEYLVDENGLYGRQGGGDEVAFSTRVDRIYRPVTAVVKAKIDMRASGGGLTASNYLISERLIEQAQSLLEAGNADEGLNALRRADTLWEHPRTTFPANFLTAALSVARVRYEKNQKNIDAAYALGRWDIVNPEDQIRHWKKCIKLNPSEPSFRYYLGVACWDSGRAGEAHEALTDALAMKQDPRWLFMLGISKIPNGIEATYALNKEYIAKNPPDEKFVPEAYYALAAVHISRMDLQMGLVYYGVAQAAESSSIRFPALFPNVAETGGKAAVDDTISGMGLLDTPMLSDVVTGTVLLCEYCQDKVKPSQVLAHKLWKCPRRRVVCQDCEKEMIFDELAAHQQTEHAKRSASGKKQSSPPSPAATKPVASKSSVPEVGKAGRLPNPKFHFFGTIQEIIPGKSSKPPVLKLVSESGNKWELRVTASAASAVLGATVKDSVVIFWRSSPTVDAIDKRSLRVPQSSSNEQYGRDVVIHVAKLPVQAVAFEFNQLRHVNHVEHGAVCSYCSGKPTTRLSVCSACKRVKYCSRDCQSIHWKRTHRVMCKNVELLDQCLSESVDVAPDRYPDKPLKDDDFFMAKGLAMPENTLDILRDILRTFETEEGRESSFECEHYMLPPYGGGEVKPGAITGSVRFFRDRRTHAIWTQFRVGYLTSTPTQLQQQELVNFFHLPPHNPLQLKYQDKMVHLERCKVFMDDADGKGFRLGMDAALDKLPAPALAEVLDYLITNATIYLS